MLLLYNWSNDKDVRKHSINKKKISIKDHIQWFKKKVNSKENLIYISFLNSIPFGMFRIEKKKKFAYLSYLIGKKFRKRGLGFLMLSKFIRKIYKKFPNLKIKACVFKKNLASKKIFKKIGFKIYKVDNNLVYYQLTKKILRS